MSKSLTIRKGDRVRVLTCKDAGKEGKVLRTIHEKELEFAETVHMRKTHTRPSQKNPQGGIIEMEGTIHVSNVMLICPGCSQPTRVGRRRDDGVRIRTCKKCGKDIDK